MRSVDDCITLRRLARPGRRDSRWRRRVDATIQHLVSRAWPIRRAEMLATPGRPAADPQRAAWAAFHAFRAQGQAMGRGVTFLGDGSCVVTLYGETAPHYVRFVQARDPAPREPITPEDEEEAYDATLASA